MVQLVYFLMLPTILPKSDLFPILLHLTSLTDESKRLRFGYVPSDTAIINYVKNSTSSHGSLWYGYMVDGGCIGAMHISIMGDTAELGISITESHRGKGLSSALFDRALVYLKAMRIKNISLQCLNENAIVIHLAKKHGLSIKSIGGGEKEATGSIELNDPLIARLQDANSDFWSLVDFYIRNQSHLCKTLNFKQKLL